MFKKYSILYGIFIPLLLLLVASLHYQRRSRHDQNSIDWKNNHQSSLMNEKAVNASDKYIPVLGYFQDVVLMRQIRFTPF
jgi:hypothetical protein